MARHLRQDIKQRKGFRSLEAEVYLNLLRTTSELTRYLVDVLRPSGITQPQYNVLRILRGAGEHGLPCGEIGERLVNREPDVTRLLDRLEERGLVVRGRWSPDGRVVTARLTADGKRLTDALDAPVDAVHRQQLGHLTRDELRALNGLLEAARHHPQAASTAGD
jgi:DNA-binding MarR family transcriptional regulator